MCRPTGLAVRDRLRHGYNCSPPAVQGPAAHHNTPTLTRSVWRAYTPNMDDSRMGWRERMRIAYLGP
jgi:hypothetical protein